MLTFEDYKNIIPLTPYEHKTGLISDERRDEICDILLKYLLKERGMIAAFNTSYEAKRKIIRSYMNERSVLPIPQDILSLQDELFYHETLIRGIKDINDLKNDKKMAYWRGDITTLNADAIVNAATHDLLGCFTPEHNCIDNIIHSRAGMQLRRDCAAIISLQRTYEQIGNVKATLAYNLPSKYVFHTIGPMTTRAATEEDRNNLKSCYISCLEQAKSMKLTSIAFCCISTGIFNFPKDEAAEIAVGTTKNWMMKNPDSDIFVVFDVFSDEDEKAYKEIFRFL